MIIPILVIILIILAAFGVRYFLQSRAGAAAEVSEEISPGLETPSVSPSFPVESGFEDAMISPCRQSPNRDACVLDIAKKEELPDLCDNMLNVSGPVSMDACNAYFAVKHRDINYCLRIELLNGDYSFANCIFDTALAEGNPGRCLLLSNDPKYTKAACAAQFGMTDSELTKIYGTVG
ncbi:hypothetical protein HZB90_01845 [archaeon]|nr:hypothetical protein [archaeon]